MLRPSGLGAYFALTFACAWILWGLAHPGIQQQLGVRLDRALLVLAGTAVPSIVALGLSMRHRLGGELLAGLVRWRVNVGWYLLAVCGPPVLMVAATAIHVALGGASPDYPEAERWPLFAINFLAVLIVGGPLGEELGWRGYALPRASARFGLSWAGALLGLAWAAWHMPLFLMTGTPQAELPFIWFALQAVALSLVLAVVWHGTAGSLLLPVLLHTSVNAFAGPLRILPGEAGSARPYMITVVLTCASALILLLARAIIPARPAPAAGNGTE
jgi:membrane protease YdiL (CAAX protease family)